MLKVPPPISSSPEASGAIRSEPLWIVVGIDVETLLAEVAQGAPDQHAGIGHAPRQAEADGNELLRRPGARAADGSTAPGRRARRPAPP